MYIKIIDIQNYHGIERLHAEFQKGINLIIGNNGAGKTSLLNALTVALSEPMIFIQGLTPTQITNIDAFQTTLSIGENVFQTENHYPIVVESTLVWNNIDYHCCKQKDNELASEEDKNFQLAKTFKENIGNAEAHYPLLCFLPAQRGKLKYNKTTSIPITTGEIQRSQGYKNAFTGAQNIDEIQRWCLQMEFAEYQKKQRIKEYSEFQSIVACFFSKIDENAKEPKLYFSSEKNSLVYFDGTSEKPLHQLSDGFQAALCMIIDLAYRAVLLNPSVSDLAKRIDGIVLIDEIEMHLHPAWQWKILNAFQQTFPEVQFIIATHSPIILSSAKDASLFLMKSPNEIVPLNSAYGYQVDDVLSLPQGSMARPANVSAYYDQIESILDTGTKEDLNKLMERAKEEFKDSPFVLKGIQDFIEVNQWVEDD